MFRRDIGYFKYYFNFPFLFELGGSEFVFILILSFDFFKNCAAKIFKDVVKFFVTY